MRLVVLRSKLQLMYDVHLATCAARSSFINSWAIIWALVCGLVLTALRINTCLAGLLKRYIVMEAVMSIISMARCLPGIIFDETNGAS